MNFRIIIVYVCMFMVCHGVGKKNPIRRVINEPQMATVVSLWSFEDYSRYLNLTVKLTCLNQIQLFTVCLTCTVKSQSFDAINNVI